MLNIFVLIDSRAGQIMFIKLYKKGEQGLKKIWYLFYFQYILKVFFVTNGSYLFLLQALNEARLEEAPRLPDRTNTDHVETSSLLQQWPGDINTRLNQHRPRGDLQPPPTMT